jgi:hypothetical protein
MRARILKNLFHILSEQNSNEVNTKKINMKHKTITIKASATLATSTEFKEYEYPKLNELLNDGWKIKEIYQATTNQNVGFLFLTFVLQKD